MEFVPGLVVADRFRLIRPLGVGGMGAVWLAQHISLDVPCAVKFILEQAARSPELRARFEREAKAAAQLRSPFVVQILDHGVWQDHPYIAMEYLEGEDLGQRLARVGKLSPAETVQIAVQIGRALTKAHAVGLVHRDLKPANVFIVRDEEHEIAKVLDFGVAKVKGAGLDGATKTGSVLGTPYYMSPEQARGSKDMDHRSDLWALAVVVYQCVTGRLPFVADALAELMVKIVIDPIPVPSHVAPVPPSFDGWWARATSRDPNQRFQTAKEFGESLGLALGVTVSSAFDMASSAALRGSASGSVPAFGSPGMMGSQSGLPMMGSQPGVVGGLPPQTATPMPMGLTPVGPMGAAPTGAQHAISVAGTPPQQGGRAPAFIAVGTLIGVLAAAGAFFALRAKGPASPGSTDAPPVTAAVETSRPSSQPSEAPSAQPSVAPVPSDTAKPQVQPQDQGSATAPAPVVSAVVHTPTKAVAPAQTAKPKANCDPNYTLDANGQKHFKPECFK